MLYERGNAAKQWIFEQLDQRFGQAPFRVLDLASGSGRLWNIFLETHPACQVVGVDTDAEAIQAGNKMYDGSSQIELRLFDAQRSLSDESFDVVVAFSAMEHVVDHSAFLRTVWSALRSGGMAYLNYDVGHFRSRKIKERLMVPISQILAWFGMEGSYMKKVDDQVFQTQAKQQGFQIMQIQKNNLHPLKGFMRGTSDNAVSAWYEFEAEMGKSFSVEQLDRVMWSTTFVLQKP